MKNLIVASCLLALAGAATAAATVGQPAPAFTVQDTTDTKWIVGLGAPISTIAAGQPNAPTGRTSRINANYIRIWDTNGAYAGNYVAQTSSTTSNYCYGGLYLTIELIP